MMWGGALVSVEDFWLLMSASRSSLENSLLFKIKQNIQPESQRGVKVSHVASEPQVVDPHGDYF